LTNHSIDEEGVPGLAYRRQRQMLVDYFAEDLRQENQHLAALPTAASLIRMASKENIASIQDLSPQYTLQESFHIPSCEILLPPEAESSSAPPSAASSPLEHSRLARRWLKGISDRDGETPSMLDLQVLVSSLAVNAQSSPTSIVPSGPDFPYVHE
jgi:hypothetical protein